MYPRIRTATLDDAVALAPAMRVRDIEEAYATNGHGPLEALCRSLALSTEAWTAEDTAGPFAIFGVAPALPDTGSPWLLGADRLVTEHRAFFLKQSRPYVARMLELYPLLLNYVDARHTDSLVYLRRVGFTIAKLIPEWGFERRPFYRFTKVA